MSERVIPDIEVFARAWESDGPEFDVEGRVLHRGGRTGHVEVRFLDLEDRPCALAQATMIERRG